MFRYAWVSFAGAWLVFFLIWRSFSLAIIMLRPPGYAASLRVLLPSTVFDHIVSFLRPRKSSLTPLDFIGIGDDGLMAGARAVFGADVFGARLYAAVAEVERAVGISVYSGKPVALGRAIEDVKKYASISRVPFTFYVAGGFVVSELLGYRPYQDIDVWFEPTKQSAAGFCVIPYGSRAYPVQIMITNDAGI